MRADRSPILALLCTGLLLAAAGIGTSPSAAETFKPFKLKTPDGKSQTLADVAGRATLVIFFSPTCRYCNASAPLVNRLHDANKDRGLSIVWVNVIPEEEKLIASWREKHGHTMPILLGGRSILNDYRLSMTPTYYLIDATLTVLWKHSGFKAGDETALEQAIQKAL
jgi:thiol-disulfide isomerase/thioredoxin